MDGLMCEERPTETGSDVIMPLTQNFATLCDNGAMSIPHRRAHGLLHCSISHLISALLTGHDNACTVLMSYGSLAK